MLCFSEPTSFFEKKKTHPDLHELNSDLCGVQNAKNNKPKLHRAHKPFSSDVLHNAIAVTSTLPHVQPHHFLSGTASAWAPSSHRVACETAWLHEPT